MSPSDKADWGIMKAANADGKFAIMVGSVMDGDAQLAFERGIAHDWYRIVDVSHISIDPQNLYRIFILTGAGKERRAVLAALDHGKQKTTTIN